jgi:hypothetical protein
MNKITAILGLAALLLAIVAVFVAIPNLNVAAVLVVLGIVAGLSYTADRVQGLLLATLVYPLVAVALGNIPTIGEKLGAIAGNIGLVAAGVAATVLAMRLIDIVKANVSELTGKAS